MAFKKAGVSEWWLLNKANMSRGSGWCSHFLLLVAAGSSAPVGGGRDGGSGDGDVGPDSSDIPSPLQNGLIFSKR